MRHNPTMQEGVSFSTVRNRLKLLCNLNPVTYQAPKEGMFVMDIENRPSHLPEGQFLVKVRFEDAIADPQVTLDVEITDE